MENNNHRSVPQAEQVVDSVAVEVPSRSTGKKRRWVPAEIELKLRENEELPQLRVTADSFAFGGLRAFVNARHPQTKEPLNVFPVRQGDDWTIATVPIGQNGNGFHPA